MAQSDEEVKAFQATTVALTPTLTAYRICTDKHHCECYKLACRRCCIPEGLAGACTAPFTLRWPAWDGFGRMIAACGLPELLTAALLLVTAGAVPEGARGAGGGMPAARLGRDCAAAEAAAATAAAAFACSASARAVCCALAAFRALSCLSCSLD